MQPPGGPATREMSESEPSPERSDALGRGRLLYVLDVLLTTRSVTAAARQLGLQPSGVSRILGELRTALDDTLLIRSGRGLVPTPKAESLRPQIRDIVRDIDAVFADPATGSAADKPAPFDRRWNVPYPETVPQLAVASATLKQDAEPAGRRQEPDKAETPPHAQLAQLIGTVAGRRKAPGHSLDVEQAQTAMSIILDGAADPVQVGAFLSFIHLQGTTATELAGFVRAARQHVSTRFGRPDHLRADLDWPCYISPRDQRPPWFFQAASLVARAGYRVVLHGSSGSGLTAGRHSVVADLLGIVSCRTPAQLEAALGAHAIAYLPLPALSPQLFRLLGLHALTETRSPAHELVHLLQPVPARATLLGVGKPSYQEIHRDTAVLLGERHLAMIDNSRDVAQFNPFRATTIHRLVDGVPRDDFVASLPAPASRDRTPFTSMEHWSAVWRGTVRDPRAESIVIATAATALLCLDADSGITFDDARQRASELWAARDRN
ncbi:MULTISPECIES: glycosyl transferase family protein [unclassified Xanthobacter]|uniref:glycosyl transferase family protein n=1 Tax=unclassified Xanthobacter TaxID=2623496 RepID=UPI001EE07B11|nr:MULTISPECIES: glycosyl transferase family protein [unclassified Xanthobacter]